MPEKEKPASEAELKKEVEKRLDENRQKILQMSEISLWLDTYDDIFSDFDPRDYSLRSLSDDFLNEAKKASRDKDPEKLELRFLIAESQRDSKKEVLIKKRLRDHFAKHSHMLQNEITKARKKSGMMVIGGISMLMAATYVNYVAPDNLMSNFLLVALEPAGWFMTWVALDNLFFRKEPEAEYNFYRKMSKCEIIFASY